MATEVTVVMRFEHLVPFDLEAWLEDELGCVVVPGTYLEDEV